MAEKSNFVLSLSIWWSLLWRGVCFFMVLESAQYTLFSKLWGEAGPDGSASQTLAAMLMLAGFFVAQILAIWVMVAYGQLRGAAKTAAPPASPPKNP